MHSRQGSSPLQLGGLFPLAPEEFHNPRCSQTRQGLLPFKMEGPFSLFSMAFSTFQGRATGAAEAEPVPQLVRVTQSRTELPAQVCSLVVVGVSSVLPKVRVSMLRRSSRGQTQEWEQGLAPCETRWG